MAPYRRPFRHVLAVTWRGSRQMRHASVLAVLSWLGVIAWRRRRLGRAARRVRHRRDLSSIAALQWLATIGHARRGCKRTWRGRTELGTVRRGRPQAGGEDPDLVHDEFAVSVEDEGFLVTWRFRPLGVGDQLTEDEIEVPGRPRYGASPAEQRAFDAFDAARAAEQLVEAQARAAEREARAIQAADLATADAARRAEIAAEARSTAAALQRVTGQRAPPGLADARPARRGR